MLLLLNLMTSECSVLLTSLLQIKLSFSEDHFNFPLQFINNPLTHLTLSRLSTCV